MDRPLARTAPLGAVALSVACCAALVAVPAHASLVSTWEVGNGSQVSNLQFDFQNGNSYLYIVHWDGLTTGRDLFDIVGAAQPGFFVSDIVTFPFGDALYGQAIGSDGNAGFGTPPDFFDFWHYWTRPTVSVAWESSFVGFGDRVVSAGSWDGWVFGGDAPPATVPAPGAVAAIVVGVASNRRRRRR